MKNFNGLEELYPDKYERCKVIINKCLYYADLTTMNIFITTEILKCEVQSKIDSDEINENDIIFNKYNGDTLKIDINQIFNIDSFDAVIALDLIEHLTKESRCWEDCTSPDGNNQGKHALS